MCDGRVARRVRRLVAARGREPGTTLWGRSDRCRAGRRGHRAGPLGHPAHLRGSAGRPLVRLRLRDGAGPAVPDGLPAPQGAGPAGRGARAGRPAVGRRRANGRVEPDRPRRTRAVCRARPGCSWTHSRRASTRGSSSAATGCRSSSTCSTTGPSRGRRSTAWPSRASSAGTSPAGSR